MSLFFLIPAGRTPAATVRQAVGGSHTSTVDHPTSADVTLYYDPDGGVRRRRDVGPTEVETANLDPWSTLHPTETDGANWELKIVHISGDDQYDSGDGLGTVAGSGGTGWVTLDSFRAWSFRLSGIGTSNDGVYTVYLSNDSGSTVHDSINFEPNFVVASP